MQELRKILRIHAERYPQMQPQDAVKLIYQNEFGGGHLIRDEQSCLDYLRMEYAGIRRQEGSLLFEDIGNGMVRVHLAALKQEELDALGEAFLRSARKHSGEQKSFLEKLDILRDLTREGIFSFDHEALDRYLSGYEKAGFPMVSHSIRYREAYAPAYRIVCRFR